MRNWNLAVVVVVWLLSNVQGKPASEFISLSYPASLALSLKKRNKRGPFWIFFFNIMRTTDMNGE